MSSDRVLQGDLRTRLGIPVNGEGIIEVDEELTAEEKEVRGIGRLEEIGWVTLRVIHWHPIRRAPKTRLSGVPKRWGHC